MGVCLVLLTGLGIGMGALVTGVLAGLVSRHLDQPVTSFVLAHPSTFWDGVLERIEALGTLGGAAAFAVAIGVAFAFVARSREPLYRCLAALGGAVLITVAVRAVVTRPVKDGPVKGFPFGTRAARRRRLRHGLCAGDANDRTPVASLPVTITFAVIGAAVAWARVYRLDHVATDVIGSLVLGTPWVFAIAWLAGRREARRDAVGRIFRLSSHL